MSVIAHFDINEFPLLSVEGMSPEQKTSRINKIDSITMELLSHYPHFNIRNITSELIHDKILKLKNAHENNEHYAMLYYDCSGRTCLHAHRQKPIVENDVFPITAVNESISEATRVLECVTRDGGTPRLHQKCFTHLNNEEVYCWKSLGNFVLPWDPNRDPGSLGNFPNALVVHCDCPRIRGIVDTTFFLVFLAQKTHSSVRAFMRFKTPEPLLVPERFPKKSPAVRRFHTAASRYVPLLMTPGFLYLSHMNGLLREEMATARRLSNLSTPLEIYRPYYFETYAHVRWPYHELYDDNGRTLHRHGIDRGDGRSVGTVSARNDVSGSFLRGGELRVYRPLPGSVEYAPGHAPEPSSDDDPDDDVPIRDLMRQAPSASTGPRPGSSTDRPVPSGARPGTSANRPVPSGNPPVPSGSRPASSGSRTPKRKAPSVPARARSAPATAPPVPAAGPVPPAAVPAPPAPAQSAPVTEATALRLALAMERTGADALRLTVALERVGMLLETWLGSRGPPNDDDADVDRV